MTVELTSTPPLEHLRPNHDLARVTLTPLLHGRPLSHGHLQIRLTAPPQKQVLSTGFPRMEGTPLLALDSDLIDGSVRVQYGFPIRGTYTLDLDISPVPAGTVFQPSHLRQTVRIYEDPAVVRHAWLLIIGLCVLGGLTGVTLSRSAAARARLLSCGIVRSLVLLGAVLGLDVVALHPPMAVKLRIMALLPGGLAGGMVVGFFVPWRFKERASA
jgi:hypothetical protein